MHSVRKKAIFACKFQPYPTMKKGILLLLAAAWGLSLQASGGAGRMKGCWADTANRQWTHAFFDRFAIFQNKFWTYDKISLGRDKGTIALKRGNERITLHLRFPPGQDSLCTIMPASGSAPATLRLLRAPAIPWETDAPDSFPGTYATDSSIIQGYIPFRKAADEFCIHVASPFSEDEIEICPRIDSLGRFTATVSVTGMTQARIDYVPDGLLIPAILFPEDTLTLYADQEKRIFLMGKNATFNQEVQEGLRRLNAVKAPDWHQSKDLAPDEWKSQCLRQMQLKRQALDAYAHGIPAPSRRALAYLDRKITMECANRMLQKSFTLKRKKFERFPPAFLHTLDSLLELARPPYTVPEDLHSALRTYCHYHATPFPVSTTLPAITLADYLHRNHIHTFSSRELSDFKLAEEGTCMALSLQDMKADTATWRTRMAPYLEAMERSKKFTEGDEFRQLADTHRDKIKTWKIRRDIEKDLAPLQLLHIPAGLKEFHAASLLARELDRRRSPFPQEIMDFAHELLHTPELYALVANRQKYYQQLQARTLSHPQSLRSTEGLENINDPARLWAEIIKPHKGKIIYADFWGTWCTPCKWQMEAVPALKASLADEKDIVFLYLAIHSPQESWLNFLKETDLTGPQAVHYNLTPEMSHMLTRYLSVSAYPTYLVIDRNGYIADRNPPTPRDGTQLAEYLHSMTQD